VFERWADAWIDPIVNAMTLKENGGKGFHYFLRDVAALFAYQWDYIPQNKPEICAKFVNKLVCVGADEKRTIFISNLEITGALMSKWKDNLYIEHRYVEGMMNKPEIPWKINGM
jgi:hypothetical protein